jgi:hypothetical protein
MNGGYMSQEQRQIELFIIGEDTRFASATGNNASWICQCGYKLPLIGRSGNTLVKCPVCRRNYQVIPEDNISLERVLCVREINS